MAEEQLSHSLHIVNGTLSLTGVKDVDRFSPEEIGISLANEYLAVKGHELTVKEINIEQGTMRIIGKIVSVAYGGAAKSKGLVKKLLK
ncbi:MAG: YabP/YqfC family sporulation protein [Christensenellaceae bacterium]|jgi:sporulation protein YabP|nr:YabP/YqfC family sporulation protein [Christensenellaceae bacterium]